LENKGASQVPKTEGTKGLKVHRRLYKFSTYSLFNIKFLQLLFSYLSSVLEAIS